MGVPVPLSFCLLSSPPGAHPRDHRCLPQRFLHQSYEGLPGTLQDSPPAYLPFLGKFPMACGDHPLSPSAIFTFTFNLHLYRAMNLWQ